MEIILGSIGRITARFNENIGRPFLHRGVDQGHGDGTPRELEIHAPARGKVLAIGRDGTYGNRIIIDLGSDADDNRWTWLGAHAESFRVAVNDWVDMDDHIGTMGNTGTVFVHLHQELRRNGVPVNPLDYLTKEDDDVSFGDIIKHRNINAPAAVVLADTLTVTQDNARRLDDLLQVKHRNIDAPLDVVAADTLIGVQSTGQRLTAVESKLDAILAALNKQ